MSNLLSEAFDRAKHLPEYLQDELAQQLIEDIENELQWQQILSQPQSPFLDELARQALKDFTEGKTRAIGFDEL